MRASADLPPRSDRILSDEWIRGQQHTVVLNGLADQHAIKRVSVQQGKLVKVKNGSLVQRERSDPMPLTLFHNKAIERTGERQLAQGMLDREFPDRHGAEENFVGRIGEDLTCLRRQVLRARDDPQKCTGIEETLHPWVRSNARSSYSGRGSKKERGTVNCPLVKPIGRGRTGTSGSGVISATGLLRLHNRMRSPALSFAKYLERWVFAS